jgi:hypothetical protein
MVGRTTWRTVMPPREGAMDFGLHGKHAFVPGNSSVLGTTKAR